jgi:hypothetical protein
MAILVIPTTNDPFSEQRTDLEGKEYVLRFDYSEREGVWYLEIRDSTDVVLAAGIKMVCNWPLTYRLPSPDLPPGEFLIGSKVPSDLSPPGLEDLAEGGRCELVYVTSDHKYSAAAIAAAAAETV